MDILILNTMNKQNDLYVQKKYTSSQNKELERFISKNDIDKVAYLIYFYDNCSSIYLPYDLFTDKNEYNTYMSMYYNRAKNLIRCHKLKKLLN